MATDAVFNFTRNYPYIEDTAFNVAVQVYENWSEQRRLISAQPRKVFTCNFYPLTKTEADLIKAFYIARKASYEQFLFDNPLDLIRYTVRFVENTFRVERVAFNTYKITVSLQTIYQKDTIMLFVNDYITHTEYTARIKV